MTSFARRLEVPVSHGSLEAILHEPGPTGPMVGAAVVCHPHPLHGGTMDNNVAYRIGKAFAQADLATLRFNFRGVGRSTGAYGGGIDEEEDVEAAIAFITSKYPGLPVWLGGFSFGSRVGLSVGVRHPAVTRLLGVGLPIRMFDFQFLGETCKPLAIVQGAIDEYAPGAEVGALVGSLPGSPEHRHFESIPGASHLFPGKLPELEAALGRAIAFLRPGAGPI